MKKKLSVLFLISAMILLNGCSSSSKKKTKEPIPVVKSEVKPVVTETKPLVTEVKTVTPETKPIVAETKTEIKTVATTTKTETKAEEKTNEKPSIIIMVVSKEEASEILKSIMPGGNYEIKGLKSEPTETKTEIKPEIKPEIKVETKPVVLTEKTVKDEKSVTSTSAVAVTEKTITKVEKKEPVVEKVTEKAKEEIVVKKDETPVVLTAQTVDNNTDSDKDGIPDYLDAVPNQVLKTTLLAQGIQKVIIADTMSETDTALTAQMMEELDKIAAVMKKDKTLKIKIISHTNNVGDEKVNLKLSEKRAIMSKEYLNSKGIPLDYVATDWKGGSMPMVANDTKENRTKNKRLEVIFYIVNIKAKK